MMGFTPGFAYLMGLDPTLRTPRLSTPRTKVPAGSVGIADQQTGIYPLDSPGGWQIIGKTSRSLFNPEQPPHFLFSPGDLVRFIPVDGGLD
jgi:KipI family sensor histidine kinase inhibitor